MQTKTLVKVGICALVPALAAACSAAKNDGAGSTNEQQASFAPHGHIMPPPGAHRASNAAGPAGAHLTYYGGPVLSSVKVYTVFWGSSATTYQAQLDQFFTTITNSAYFDWLSEYDTSTQNIGRGSYGGTFVDTSAPAGSTIDDSQIQSELASLISSGKVPPNDANNLYFFFFPPGVTITMGGSSSCSAFCGYHGTMVQGGSNAYYAVIPDQACCVTGGLTQFDVTTEVSSHELIEATTDSAVGLATTIGAPLAWYDQTNGEIGDICAWQNASLDGYNIQLEWSNSQNNCIATGSGGGDGGTDGGDADAGNDFALSESPSSATVQAGSSTTFTVSASVTAGSADTLSLSVSGLPAGVTGSFSPSSITSNGGSSVLTVTAASNALSSSSTISITATGSSNSHSASASLTVTGGSGSNLIGNGGFESGDLTDWTAAKGQVSVVSGGHGGSYSALIGSTSAYNGNSVVTQSVTIPSSGTTTLSFWGNYACPGANAFEYERVWILNSTNHKLAQVSKACDNNQTWENTTFDLTPYAGQTITLQFLDRDDKSPSDPTYWYLDDVSVTNQ